MEIINPVNMVNDQELAITQLQSRPAVPDGLYRAIFTGYTTFMEKTPWGEKKAVRMFFTLISGPAKNTKLSFKAYMLLDQATNQWIIGPRSKIAAAIKAINPYGNSINASNINTPVYVRVTNRESKKTGDLYPMVEEVHPMPPEESAKIVNILKEAVHQSNIQGHPSTNMNQVYSASPQSRVTPVQHQIAQPYMQTQRVVSNPQTVPQSISHAVNTTSSSQVSTSSAGERVTQPQSVGPQAVFHSQVANQQNENQPTPEHILNELENLEDYLS